MKSKLESWSGSGVTKLSWEKEREKMRLLINEHSQVKDEKRKVIARVKMTKAMMMMMINVAHWALSGEYSKRDFV